MNYIDATKNYAERMLLAVQDLIKHATFDRTFRAKITSQISSNKYKILYKNKEYPASCDIKAKIGDMVWVCAPENNWNKLYIQSSKSDDETITQVNGVKGSAETSYKSGYVNISPEDIGLGKVNNTSDIDKPISTAVQNALNNKSPKAGSSSLNKLASQVEFGDGGAFSILQGNGTYRQKVECLDNATSGDAVFRFSQSEDSGVSYKQLFEIRDDGSAYTKDGKIYTTGNKPSKADVGLDSVPNVATNDQAPTFTQASSLTNIGSGEKLSLMLGKIAKAIADFIIHKTDSVIHITSNDRSLWNTVSNKVESESGKGLSTNDYTDIEQTTLADVNSKKHTHTNKTILDGITQTLIEHWNAAEMNVQADFNVTDTTSDAFIKNKPTSLPANGGTASILSNAMLIADYNTFIPSKVASGAITPVKAGADANSPWVNTTSGFLIQSNGTDSWHLLIFRSGEGGWAYRSYYQGVWSDWKIWSTFDGKYSSLVEKPTSFPPSTHSHTKSQITDFPTSMPASDVPTWAKADTKPTYTWDEVNGRPTSFNPATHTHEIINVNGLQGKLDGKFPYRNISGDDISLNDFRTAGIYFGGGGNLVKDKPSGVDAFGLFIYNTAGGFITQDLIVGNVNPGKRYTRIYYNSAWTSWIVIPTFASAPESGKVLISNDTFGGIKTSPYTIESSVPSNAKFTDTVYTHPNSGATAGTYLSVTVDAQGHVTGGTNPTTFDGNSTSATKLQKGRTIAIGGGATGTATSFDGSANVSIPITSIDASYLTGYSSTKRPYFNTHPENGGAILPFINNDLAFLTKKGGSMTSYKTTSTDYTLQTLTNSGQVSINTGAPFDGSPSYASFTVSDTNDVIIIDIVCHKVFTYSNNFYIDFGNTGWRAKDIRFYTYNSNSDNSEVAYKLMGSVTNSEFGQFVCSSSYTYVNSSGTTVQGFNKLRVVLTNFQSVNPRIAAIGVLNYSSPGLTETFLSRGGGTVYGNVSPHSNNAYTLGATSNRWSNGYFETINVNSASKVPNLNADKLDDQDGSYYLNYNNMTNTPTSKIITVTTSDWTSTAPYTKTILVSGMKSTDEPSIFPYTPKTMTSTQITTTKKMASYITDGETNDGSITLYCGIVKPTSEFQILLIGVSP